MVLRQCVQNDIVIHAEKSILNLVNPDQIWINYDPKRFLCVFELCLVEKKALNI